MGRLDAIQNVESTHHTHVWSLNGEHHVLTTHVVVDEYTSNVDVKRVKDAIKRVLEVYEFSHITLEIEYGEDDCAMARKHSDLSSDAG